MDTILYFFIAILVIANAKLFIQLALSVTYNLTRQRQSNPSLLKISIIVPAYNEDKTITSTIQSLQKLDYPNYEIIVVDDGSSDQTYQKALQSKDNRTKVIHQPNMGKPNALNTGIAQSSGDIVLTVDADTTLHKDALSKIADHFAMNPKIGAIAGNVKIKNEHSIINVLQSAEYATGINLVRKAQSVLGCVLVVPGPIAAIRREVIQRSGGFSDETFAEDFDMTLAILKAGYRIEYEEYSLAYTDAPKNTQDLIKQRRRWYRGMIQVLDKYKSMYLNPKYGLAGTVGIPNLWLEAVSPFINLSLLLLILLTWAFTGQAYLTVVGIVVTFVVFFITNTVILSLEPRQKKRNYLIIPLLLFYNTFLDGIRIMSLTEETINTVMEWEKPKR
jgi:poly-beta-1,6 N-acetyl-D-glucosamine synthase